MTKEIPDWLIAAAIRRAIDTLETGLRDPDVDLWEQAEDARMVLASALLRLRPIPAGPTDEAQMEEDAARDPVVGVDRA